MQYAKTLPLRDHEVVLTFDDGRYLRTAIRFWIFLPRNA